MQLGSAGGLHPQPLQVVDAVPVAPAGKERGEVWRVFVDCVGCQFDLSFAGLDLRLASL